MENGRMNLSQKGKDRLDRLVAELEMDRPDALRLAFAKGIMESEDLPEHPGGNGWTIPQGVVAKGDQYLHFKHLIIEKLGRPIEDDEVDKYLLRFIEAGLEITNQEIKNLSDLDNYLLMLVEKAEQKAKEAQ